MMMIGRMKQPKKKKKKKKIQTKTRLGVVGTLELLKKKVDDFFNNLTYMKYR